MDDRELARRLREIDGRGYGAYKSLLGSYRFPRFTLYVDHVQGDPYAAPSRARLRVPRAETGIPDELLSSRTRRVALEDFLARTLRDAAGGDRFGRGSGGSGVIAVDAGGQQVLERTAVRAASDWVEARVEVGLPAAGRRILGREAEELLLERLPALCSDGLRWESVPREGARDHVRGVERQEHLRRELSRRRLVGFVADGSLLPRRSGVSDEPLASAIPFASPPSLRVELDAGDGTVVSGMGIPEGVSLIVGGGYHGKSTLLKALERAVYPHVEADGRHRVVSRADAVKVRAEDGRRVAGVDISGFIQGLPGGRTTRSFSSEDASGSTSQAASLAEALEVGAKVLLMDEDTCATNFMVRDARMQALVGSREEPIVGLLDRVKELHERLGVSTVLVMGGSGDYFEPADNIIKMAEFRPVDVTARAKEVALERPTGRRPGAPEPLRAPSPRSLTAGTLDASRGRRPVSIGVKDVRRLSFGEETVDLGALDQLVDPSQTRAIGRALALLANRFGSDSSNVAAMMDALDALLDEEGIDRLGRSEGSETHPGNLARPRRFEVSAALNRLRSPRLETTPE